MMGSVGLAWLAGLVTTLSPCVLPVLPLLLGSGLQRNRLAPAFTIAGMMLSFIAAGMLLSRFGALLGGPDRLRTVAAVSLIALGIVLWWPRLQERLGERLSAWAGGASSAAGRLDRDRPWGALLGGALLGLVWSPCAGPTLAVAVSLAAAGDGWREALLLMTAYAIGAAVPMTAVAYGAREFVRRRRQKLLGAAETGKKILGALTLATGLLVLTGFEKSVEARLLSGLGEGWIDLITKF